MKKYISFFHLRFQMGLQYRTAAAAGIVTQFVWGFMECFAYRAFYRTNPAAFPMTFSATVAYIWLRQAFLALSATWMLDNEIFDMIMSGNVAYEMCRPISLYNMWFARSTATRLARAVLRCWPILTVAFLLPEPFRMQLPKNIGVFALFLLSMVLALGIAVAYGMLLYVASFYTVSAQGLRIFSTSLVEFLSGDIMPLPFLPGMLRRVIELLPFAGMLNAPLRIYSGDLTGSAMWQAMLLQLFWLFIMTALGKLLCRRAEYRVTVQGG